MQLEYLPESKESAEPTVTNFPEDDTPNTPCDDHFENLEMDAIDLKNPAGGTIEDGQYLLVRKFFLGGTSADICAYKKKVV